jgi:hypothetical protein
MTPTEITDSNRVHTGSYSIHRDKKNVYCTATKTPFPTIAIKTKVPWRKKNVDSSVNLFNILSVVYLRTRYIDNYFQNPFIQFGKKKETCRYFFHTAIQKNKINKKNENEIKKTRRKTTNNFV